MKAFPEALKAALAGDATTLCHAWRVRRRDGVVLGFSSHDRDLTFGGTVFAAASGLVPGATEWPEGLAADAADVAGAFSSDAIREDDLLAGRYDGALVETYLLDWTNPDAAHALLSTRELGEVRAGGGAFRAELRSLAARLDRPQGRVYARRCDAVLGDQRCRFALDAAPFVETGVIESVLPDRLVVTGAGTAASGWFREGRVAFQTGPLAGLEADIAEDEMRNGSRTIILWIPLSQLPEAGDQVQLTAGCDKQFATCQEKFANAVNFQGFPHMPGSDFAYGYADGDRVHDGRPVVP